ncbi:MAG: ABC transporter ATP-binding protein [Chitinophagaceae bacterium]
MKKFKRIFSLLKEHKSSVILALFLNWLSTIFSIFSFASLPIFLQIIFNVNISDSDIVKPETIRSSTDFFHIIQYHILHLSKINGTMWAVVLLCGIVLVTVFFRNLFTYYAALLMSMTQFKVSKKIRMQLYQKMISLPIGVFNEHRKGDLLSRATNDVMEAENAFTITIDGFIRNPIIVLIYLTVLIWLSPILSIILLVLLPLAGFVIGKVSKNLKQYSNNSSVKMSELFSIQEETMGGMRVIKAFRLQKYLIQKFKATNEILRLLRNSIAQRLLLASPLSEFLSVSALCVILYIGGKLVLGNSIETLTAPAFIMYITIFTQIISPAKAISTSYYSLQKGEVSFQRIEAILKLKNRIEDVENPIILDKFQDKIEFKNISFSFPGRKVLDNVSLTIPKGKIIALVGASGAGKSTLVDLIPRFYDVEEGELLIDGKNIKEVSLDSLHSLFGIVTQEPVVFNDTIKNNILMGKENATDKEIEQVAYWAHIDKMIASKPEGMSYTVGDRGSKLSGGERQRLTIARALLKNPPILILDEATSALDTESEKLVQDAIYKMMKNRTSIVIAHRLSTIKNADEIVVLESGRIVEQGKHEFLMQKNGYYKKLVALQEMK